MKKSVARMLVLSIICLGFTQSSSQAMLVPAGTNAVLAENLDAAADRKTIQSALESQVIRDRLHGLGLSDAEIQSRLSRLSESQKHQLASQIRAINPAGDGGWVVGILVIVVLVLLIIYLAKRV